MLFDHGAGIRCSKRQLLSKAEPLFLLTNVEVNGSLRPEWKPTRPTSFVNGPLLFACVQSKRAVPLTTLRDG